jgi:hypothetical protein
MHFVTLWTKTKMASWRTAFHLLLLEVFIDLIHFVKKFYFWKTSLQMNFREMNRKKFQISSQLVSLYWTLWVSVGLIQYVLKCPAPKFGPWNLLNGILLNWGPTVFKTSYFAQCAYSVKLWFPVLQWIMVKSVW